MKEKLPYMKWFWGDAVRDTRILSLEARGAWADLIALMHDGEPYGYLSINGKPLEYKKIARFMGISVSNLEKVIEEILDNNIFSRGDDGVIFCRRMVRDNYLRKARGEGGKKGGNPNLKDTDKDNDKVNLQDNLSVDTTMESPESRVQSPEANANTIDSVKDPNLPQTPDPRELPNIWSEFCPSLPQVRELSKSRIVKIKSRLKEHPDLSWWKEVFRLIELSPFCRGENGTGWHATFDWIIQNSDNAIKVSEGKYSSSDKRKPTQQSAMDRVKEACRRHMEADEPVLDPENIFGHMEVIDAE